MVKKLQKMADKKKAADKGAFGGAIPAGLLDSALAQNVKDSAQQIWAAGLGAFAKAKGEQGKVFEALVAEGMKLQKKTQSAAEEKLGAMASRVTGMAGDVGNKAGQHWDKLETIFEERVAKALTRLGVPSGNELGSLIKRIDTLAATVGIKSTKPAAAKKTAKKVVATKAAPAAKKAAAKPAAKAPAKKATTAAKPAAKKAMAKKAAAPVKAVAKKAAAKPVAAKKAPVKKASAPKKAVAPAATPAAVGATAT